MLYNSPTSTFNFNKNFGGNTPGPPLKGEGSPPIHIPGYATGYTLEC